MLRNLGKENRCLLLLVYGHADVMVLENQNSNKLDSGAMSFTNIHLKLSPWNIVNSDFSFDFELRLNFLLNLLSSSHKFCLSVNMIR